MLLTNKYKRVPLEQIQVKREERQRRVINTSGLLDSIRLYGVIQPIIIDRDHVLIAGERRLAASKELGLPDVPCRYIDELSPREAKIIELEENLKRMDLPWRDEVASTAQIHEMYSADDSEWTQAQTAKTLSINPGLLSEILRVARDLENPKIANASGMAAAYNILTRIDSRRMGDAMSDIIEAGASIFKPGPATIQPLDGGQPLEQPIIQQASAPESVLNEDFLEWAPAYSGQPFNFIHCDFPYGINVFAGPQSGRDAHTTYDDNPEVYWRLIRCLCDNRNKIMSHSAHLMFWFSMEHYAATLEAFSEWAPDLTFNVFPLIWFKTDNAGILPDPKRGPRRVYETALIASREDRLIVKAVGNAYGAPTDKAHHPSTKPEPVLKHFFQMFIDEHTRLLDPTCGGGSALRAAESMGAAQVLGLEIDPEHYGSARSALRLSRAMRKASK